MNSQNIQNVKSRLEFVSKLTSVKEAFRGHDLIEHTENNGWTHPYKNFSGLRFYLILTCFDILGSNKEFIDFSAWLASSKHEADRESVFGDVSTKTLSANSVKEVYAKYNEIYGVSKGFKRFINEVIPKDNRTMLLDSIRIRKIGYQPQQELKYEPTENKKINFLYELRNSFTHTGSSYASPGGGIFEDDGTPEIFDGKEMWGYQPIHIDKKSDFYYEFSVRKWPQILVDIVNDAIKNNE